MQTQAQNLLAALTALCVIAGGTGPAQDDKKAGEVLAATRKAIGGKRLESLESLGLQAAAQRNVGDFQMKSDLELFLELPDKYVRSETSSNPMINMTNTLGFSGDRPVKSAAQGMSPGGGMLIRMGGPGPGGPGAPAEKPTPEQQQEIDRQMVRAARHEISRLMLGWFGMTHPAVGAQYAYAGEAESPDGKAFVVDAKGADGFAARLFIDEQTYLPLMLTYQGPKPRIVTARGPRGGPGAPAGAQTPQAADEERRRRADETAKRIDEMEKQPPEMAEYALYFDDWREEGGIKFPHSLRRASAGATTEEWTISKVTVNPRIDPKKFETDGGRER